MSQYNAMLDAHARAACEQRSPGAGVGPAVTPEQFTRLQSLHARALEVFGSSVGATVWCHSPNVRACGRWTSPWALSRESSDGWRSALAELDHIESVLRGRAGWAPLLQ